MEETTPKGHVFHHLGIVYPMTPIGSGDCPPFLRTGPGRENPRGTKIQMVLSTPQAFLPSYSANQELESSPHPLCILSTPVYQEHVCKPVDTCLCICTHILHTEELTAHYRNTHIHTPLELPREPAALRPPSPHPWHHLSRLGHHAEDRCCPAPLPLPSCPPVPHCLQG